MTHPEQNSLFTQSNESDKHLLLCHEGILKGVSEKVLRSDYGDFTFGSIYDPLSGSIGDCLIDLEKEYTLTLAKSLIDLNLKVEPGSNHLRLRAPVFQSLEVQELVNNYFAKEVNESNGPISSNQYQKEDYLENVIMSIAEQCKLRDIPAALAIFLPTNKN